jgi:hypothetical protein
VLLDAIDVEARDLVDGLIEVDDARCAIDVLPRVREGAASSGSNEIPNASSRPGKFARCSRSAFSPFPGGGTPHDRFELSAPCPKVTDPVGGADYADPNLAALPLSAGLDDARGSPSRAPI